MRIERADHGLDDETKRQVMALLRLADREFVPPLSARSPTTQSDLNGAGNAGTGGGPTEYLREILSQRFLLSREDEEVAGFLSYRTDTLSRRPGGGETLYVTTVIGDPARRRQGITSALYRELLGIADGLGRPVSTRTWTQNDGHLGVLARFGFEEVHRIADDRGAASTPSTSSARSPVRPRPGTLEASHQPGRQ